MKKEQGLAAVKAWYGPKINWVSSAKDAIKCSQYGTFTLLTLKEFTKRSDIEYSDMSKIIMSENEKIQNDAPSTF